MKQQLAGIRLVIDNHDSDPREDVVDRRCRGVRVAVHLDCGQADREGGAEILARTLRDHGSVVRLDEMLDDGEADAQTAVPARRARVVLPESIEHMRKKTWRNADPCIANGDSRLTTDV